MALLKQLKAAGKHGRTFTLRAVARHPAAT